MSGYGAHAPHTRIHNLPPARHIVTNPPTQQMAAIHLVDSQHCSNPANFISASLLALCAMTRLELPHVNVLSKIDLVELNGPTRNSMQWLFPRFVLPAARQPHSFLLRPHFLSELSLDMYTEFLDLASIASLVGSEQDSVVAQTAAAPQRTPRQTAAEEASESRTAVFLRRHRKLNAAMSELVNDYNLVGFIPLDIQVRGLCGLCGGWGMIGSQTP